MIVPWSAAAGSLALSLVCAAALLRFEELEGSGLCQPTTLIYIVDDPDTGFPHKVRAWWGVPDTDFWRYAGYAMGLAGLALVWGLRRRGRSRFALGIVMLALNVAVVIAAIWLRLIETAQG